MPGECIEIRGARVHNLKNIDVRIPHDQLVVVTGVSGSGKSTLVYDIVFAEGRRRFVESLSSYARQFLERMERPDADEILGVAPTVAIRQRNTTRNRRSTVATATEIHDYLRLLFGRVGRTYCTECGERVMSDSVDAVADEILAQDADSRWFVLFPLLEDEDARAHLDDARYEQLGSARNVRLARLRERGFNRLYQDGRTVEFSTPESLLEIDFDRPVYVLIDRIAIGPGIRERVVDAVEIAYGECDEVRFGRAGGPERELRFTSRFECGRCELPYRRPEPAMFSFNSPGSACETCDGLGQVQAYAMDLIASDQENSLRLGAIPAWEGKYFSYKIRMIEMAWRRDIPTDVPYRDLSSAHRKMIEEGDGVFEGIRGFLRRLENKRWKPHIAAMLSRWRRSETCPDCQGTRLSKSVLNVRVGGESIASVLNRSLRDALEFFEQLRLQGAEEEIAIILTAEIKARLRFLVDVGLEYLTLDRQASTLSGGEAQRIQLASSLGSRLVGVCYVLDEPSIGLHCRDTGRLIGVLRQLRDLGNTVLVVEHDREMMRAADHLIDLGPGAGEDGGKVVFNGPPTSIPSGNGSLTAKYLGGERSIPVPTAAGRRRPGDKIRILGATGHNLKNVDAEFPIELMTVVTGVSGSGKSTLVLDVLRRALADPRFGTVYSPQEPTDRPSCRSVVQYGLVDNVVVIDQAALDRTSRSTPATYMGAFGAVRQLFANTETAKQRGFSPSHFSFNTGAGGCYTCSGTGKQRVDMQFLADVDIPCEECDGKRYGQSVLEVEYRGKNIFQVLEMTVTEAIEFFSHVPTVVRRLSVLTAVGLGYIRLGQPATHLSGGEAQRLKLALHIADSNAKNTLFLFDEPTTGLHFEDIRKLLGAFETLLAEGATLVVIEHNLDVIKCADWIVDMGPEGGDLGGEVVAMGPPEFVANCTETHTARYLREVLN